MYERKNVEKLYYENKKYKWWANKILKIILFSIHKCLEDKTKILENLKKMFICNRNCSLSRNIQDSSVAHSHCKQKELGNIKTMLS